MLKRKIYNELVSWKKNNGATAMMIDGARRVGKSYIAEEFAKSEYKSYILIDFGKAPKDVLDLFVNDSSDLDLFFAKLAAFYSTALHKRESLIIFDEVQQYPRARQLIKYLVADGRFDYLETGSLIRLKKNVQDIIIPSEEDHIEMFPLDFEEFLWAMGDEATYPLIRHCFETKTPLGDALHRKIMNDFRQYILVGGMPQSVIAYIDGKNFEASDVAKRRILKLYRDDVANSPKDTKIKCLPYLTVFRVSFPKRKRNTSFLRLISRHGSELMRILLFGSMKQWLSMPVLMPPIPMWGLL